MRLLREIRPGTSVEVYRVLRDLLRGNERIIFDSMVAVTSSQRQPFTPPGNRTEQEDKLNEIQTKLQTAELHGNRGLMPLRFMREVAFRAKDQAPRLPANIVNGVIQSVKFEVPGKNLTMELTSDLNWQVSWMVKHRGIDHSEKLSIEIFDADFKEIVPDYVIEYANTAIHAYVLNMNSTSAALLSIALEATLRDVLSSRGYTYIPGALPVDTFTYTEADVSVNGSSYAVTFRDPRLKPVADFNTSAGGNTSMEIKMRRYLNTKNAGRVDLYVLAPIGLVDHWSLNDVSQPANPKSIGGLGQALRIAREVEKFLQPSKLPVELDDVILTVRNNLIHLSEETMKTKLDLEDDDNRPMTLHQFLDNASTMFAFVTTAVRFVNDSYVELRATTP